MTILNGFSRSPVSVALAAALYLACPLPELLNSGRQQPTASQASTAFRPAAALAAAHVAAAQAEVLTNCIGMELVAIPAGEFLMGSDNADARDDEQPQHLVRITRPLWVGRYEVTQAEYEKVMGTNPSWFSPTGGGKNKAADIDTSRLPVEQVTWEEAVQFCEKLSALPEEKQAGRVYRLPTEAEWQYCCRAGTTTLFHYGDSLTSTQANINGRFPYGDAPRGPYLGRTTAVGSYEPNAFGLYDMHGNVAELCSDWFGRDYYQHSPTDDPQGPEDGADKLVMGGSWAADAFQCRCAHRRSNAPSGAASYFGFRVVCERK